VVHLAAVSAVTAAVKDPRAAWSVNLGGTLNLTEALLEHAPGCRLVHVSSAEVYGLSLGERRPTDETALLQPMNPYAASKAAGDILVRQCSATGLDAVVARPFNHTGAGQAEVFALPSFAAQIARIEAGLQTPVLMVGDLDEERDFLDVDDVATAYLKMIEFRNDSGRAAVFNIASGTPRRIGDVLNGLIERARVRVEVRVDPERLRRSTMRGVTGDAAALARATGWRPTRPFEQTLDDLVAWSRSQTAAG
jgi:GDP-4-dehydro-6-deoxy-D-mannose reductase